MNVDDVLSTYACGSCRRTQVPVLGHPFRNVHFSGDDPLERGIVWLTSNSQIVGVLPRRIIA
jgi:hypothetical protein